MARKKKKQPVFVPDGAGEMFENPRISAVDGDAIWAVMTAAQIAPTFVNLEERRCLLCGRAPDCIHQVLARRERTRLLRRCRGAGGVVPDSPHLFIRSIRRGYASVLKGARQ